MQLLKTTEPGFETAFDKIVRDRRETDLDVSREIGRASCRERV